MVNCDETYPLRSVPFAFCLGRSPGGRSGYFESSTTYRAQQFGEFEEEVSEAAEETTKEVQKSAKEITEKSGEATQKLPLKIAIHTSRAQSPPRMLPTDSPPTVHRQRVFQDGARPTHIVEC